MTIEQILEGLTTLSPAELHRVQELLSNLTASPTDAEAARWRGLEAWRQLDNGLVEGSRVDLSAGIDEAVYRAGR